MPSVYPISLLIEGRRCLVIGGGKVAERKVLSLLEAGAQVRVVSPEATREIADLAAAGRIEWRRAEASEADLADAFLVIAATDDAAVNARLAAAANAAGKLVNAVDQPADCNFFVPASVRRGPVLLTVSTGGGSPALAKRLREKLEAAFGPEYGELAALMERLRPEIMAAIDTQARRAEVWERILDSAVLELLGQGNHAEAETLARELAGLPVPPSPERRGAGGEA
ncbi:MAG: bifunctional precorrin-2 dehydrogenase/sirohydrochlorin ferrochelatase [Armatimonadetes bacterium]|nr:bifunctional precorrin-2 dehydrogenase/sirohydrochlorin ferrochelatase [Armatimonadota bacterium]